MYAASPQVKALCRPLHKDGPAGVTGPGMGGWYAEVRVDIHI